MSDFSTCTPEISCPQDRIDILEDLVAFHAQQSMEGANRLLRLAVDLNSETLATAYPEALRAIISITRAGVTRLAHDLTQVNLDSAETVAALRRSSFIAQHKAARNQYDGSGESNCDATR